MVGAGSDRALQFAQSVLGALAASPGHRTLLDTLRQLARASFRIKLAAAALSVHPHTMSYRIKQIRTRFGIDLDDPDVRLRIQLALLILDAHDPDTASSG
jgi:DNA-binding PucR family transcriptional regulator